MHLSPTAQANLLAGHAVACASAFLDGRHGVVELASNADSLFLDLMVVHQVETNGFLDPVRLLLIAMMRTARYGLGDARREKWQQVMGSLVELVQHESRELRSRFNEENAT